MIMNIDQLTEAMQIEKQHYNPPKNRDDLPLSYDDITPVWLTNLLCSRIPGAEVMHFRLDVEDEGNTNRRRIFLEYNEVGKQANLPVRVFCKAMMKLENRVSLGVLGGAGGEANFYNFIRPELSIEAPIAYYARLNPETLNSFVMLSDLGEETTFCQHTTNISRENIEDQLRILAGFHGKYLESPELDKSLKIFPTWPVFFGLFHQYYAEPCGVGFERAEEVIPPRLFARKKDIWPVTLQSAKNHLGQPYTLTHGDVHLRNWYKTGDGRMGLNDWQSVNRGHWCRDLTYALVTALTVENRRAWERDLLDYYVDQLRETSGKNVAFDGVFKSYRQQLLSVLAFWTITLNPAPELPDMQPSDASLEFIRRITTAMDDVDAMESF